MEGVYLRVSFHEIRRTTDYGTRNVRVWFSKTNRVDVVKKRENKRLFRVSVNRQHACTRAQATSTN